MGKVQAKVGKVFLEVTNMETGVKTPVRFYSRDNEINENVLKSLANRVFGSKYGSARVADIKLDDVINPETKTPAMDTVYIEGEERQVPVKQLLSFSTGYDRETGKEAENAPYIIQLEAVEFEIPKKDGGTFTLRKVAYRDFEGEDKGVVKNSEAFKALKDAINAGGRTVTLDIGDREVDGQKQLYISKILPAEQEVEKSGPGTESPER